jgi:hypothetical protein
MRISPLEPLEATLAGGPNFSINSVLGWLIQLSIILRWLMQEEKNRQAIVKSNAIIERFIVNEIKGHY